MKHLFFSLLLFFVFTSLQAQKKESNQHQFSKDNFLLGEKVKTENEEYYFLLDVLATTNNPLANQQVQGASALSGSSKGLRQGERMLKKKHVYQIYQTLPNRVQQMVQAHSQQSAQGTSASNTQQLPVSTGDFLVAWNDRTKDFGIVTGSILIELRNFSDANDLARDYNLLITHQFKILNNLLIVKAPLEELTRTLSRVQSDNRVDNAELEILENFQYAQ